MMQYYTVHHTCILVQYVDNVWHTQSMWNFSSTSIEKLSYFDWQISNACFCTIMISGKSTADKTNVPRDTIQTTIFISHALYQCYNVYEHYNVYVVFRVCRLDSIWRDLYFVRCSLSVWLFLGQYSTTALLYRNIEKVCF